MKRTAEKRSGSQLSARINSVITLANWQLRESWRFLLLTGTGVVVATVLVCVLPLYSEVALSAGLRAVLAANPANSSLLVQGSLQSSFPSSITQMTRQLQQDLQKNLGTYVNPTPQFFAQIPRADLYPGNPEQHPVGQMQVTDSTLTLQAFAQSQISSHVTLVQGRLPRPENAGIEIALTPQSALQMHLSVGDTLYVASPITVSANGNTSSLTWQLHVVGLFTPTVPSDPFWQGNSFSPELLGTVNPDSYLFPALTSNESLFSLISQNAATYKSAEIDVYDMPVLDWNYQFNISQIDAAHIATLANDIQAFQTTATNSGDLNDVTISNVMSPSDVLAQYGLRTSLAQIPEGVLLLLIVGMVLLFIGLMINLLMEQRAEAIAVLRSRGASRRQIFSAFTIQAFLLSLPVLIIGPLLAIPVARLLVEHLLSGPDQQALNLIGGNPLLLILQLWPFSLAAIGVTLFAILFALFQAIRLDALAWRQEAGRPKSRPLWQRLYLDILLLLLALGGYGYTLYLNHTGTLDAQTSAQVVSPLVLISSALFLLAMLLVFLRFFARLSAKAAGLASHRSKSASSMLALAQIARTPRQATRMLLLLTLTTAFALFALVFSASQAQRITDIAGYEAGADFSGRILNSQPELNASVPANQTARATLAQQNARYRAIPGVLSATMGFMGTVTTLQASQLTIKAVDANTFASTGIWTTQDSPQSLTELMALLTAQRASALTSHIVPAIVDAATWDNLHLSSGKHFALQLTMPDPAHPGGSASTTITFLALVRVQHIPTLSDSSTSLDQASNGGILVDYLSAVDGYAHASPTPQPLPISYVWLHTSDDAVALASVRAAFTRDIAAGFSFFDRHALIVTLQHDPITIDIGGILALGTLTPLVLAVIGSLLASWQNARSRLLSFVLLRALGTTPRQLASILSWEQSVIYVLMLGFGILSGVLLAAMVLPVLIVTSIANADSSGITVSTGTSLQQILPSIRVMIPSTLGIVLALLIVICIVAQGMMVRVVIRPSLSQTLRLNTD